MWIRNWRTDWSRRDRNGHRGRRSCAVALVVLVWLAKSAESSKIFVFRIGVDRIGLGSGLSGGAFTRVVSERVGIQNGGSGLLAGGSVAWFGWPCARSGSSARRRRRTRDLFFQVIEILLVVGVFCVRRFDSGESHFFDTSSGEMNFDASLRSPFDAERSLERLR